MDLPGLVLVHGGAHAGDCWDLVIAELACRETELRVRQWTCQRVATTGRQSCFHEQDSGQCAGVRVHRLMPGVDRHPFVDAQGEGEPPLPAGGQRRVPLANYVTGRDRIQVAVAPIIVRVGTQRPVLQKQPGEKRFLLRGRHVGAEYRGRPRSWASFPDRQASAATVSAHTQLPIPPPCTNTKFVVISAVCQTGLRCRWRRSTTAIRIGRSATVSCVISISSIASALQEQSDAPSMIPGIAVAGSVMGVSINPPPLY